MPLQLRDPEKFCRNLTIAALSFMVCWGFVLVLAQIRPFWIDEWRIIYNLKYKSPTALWGQLYFLQQFPRVYLELIKSFCATFDYSYFTLRLPSFLAGTLAIVLCYRLMKNIFRPDQLNRFLFVLIVVSSHAFTEYYVQIKQYTMEMLLSLLAIWQLMQLCREGMSTPRYLVLCLSFFIAPFFSYTYPIVAAPIFVVVSVQTIHFLRRCTSIAVRAEWLFTQWFPLLMCLSGIAFFYVSDVAQLMADGDMHQYWAYQMMGHNFDSALLFRNIFRLFAQVGGGDVLEFIFGVLGVVAFISSIHRTVNNLLHEEPDTNAQIRLYCVLLLLFAIALFISGRLPLGEARLNIFTVPAIAFLIIDLLEKLKQDPARAKFSKGLSAALLVGSCAHIVTSSVKVLVGADNHKKLDIYVHTENAILLAKEKKMPIFITSGVAYPYQKVIKLPQNDLGNTLCIPPGYRPNASLGDDIPGDWVLETFPAYKQRENVDVYAIGNASLAQEYLKQMPAQVTSAIVGDGINYSVISR